MGNKVSQKSSFNIMDVSELKEFMSSMDMTDEVWDKTNLSISSKCLLIVNNLINHLSSSSSIEDDLNRYLSCNVMPGVSIAFDRDSLNIIDRLKASCHSLKHVSVFNSTGSRKVEEIVELNNFPGLINLHLENIPITFVQGLKSLRQTLLKVTVHECLSDLESLIKLCGGDHSFSGQWDHLQHLDVRYNGLVHIDNSVQLLPNLTVLDVSRNNLQSIEFIENISTLTLLNASYNCIKILPKIKNHCLKVMIIAYNYIESLEEIQNLKCLKTLNASYNLISSRKGLQCLFEMDSLENLLLQGNPICNSDGYRISVLSLLSEHIMITFALDGQTFSKKERNCHLKIPIIVVESPTNSSHNSALIVKRDKIPIIPHSTSSTQGRIRTPVEVLAINPDVNAKNEKKTKQCQEPTFESTLTSDIDNTTVSSCDILAISTFTYSKLPNFYNGKPTSNLICVAEKNRNSFFKVSFQIMDDRFMAVDEHKKIVDNINLWCLLYIFPEHHSNNILKLLFFDENLSRKTNEFFLLYRTLEFANSDESKIFLELLSSYVDGFSIQLFNNFDIPFTKAIITCSTCLEKFQFNKETFRPISCQNCQNCDFVIRESSTYDLKHNLKGFEENGLLCPGTSLLKVKTHLKAVTSDIVINAMQVCSTEQSSATYSFQTALDESFNTGSNQSESSMVVEKSPNSDSDNKLDFEKPITFKTSNDFLVPNKPISPVKLEKNNSLQYLKSFLKSGWASYQPLSNVTVYMNDITKIDERIKLHFLTNVMNDNENIVGAFKSYIFSKPNSCVATEALVIISTLRIMVFNWTDKDSPSFEECLKFVIEFQLKKLIEINGCLNHQWIEIKSKSKSATLLIGNSDTSLMVMRTVAGEMTETVSRLKIQPLIELRQLKCEDFVEQVMKVVDKVSRESLLMSFDYYFMKSCSLMIQTTTEDQEYVPIMIGFYSENIFFIYVKFQNKSKQMNLELFQTISIYDIDGGIIVDEKNNHRCTLKVAKNNESQLIEMEFMSPAARSQALLCIERMWRETFQIDLQFNITQNDNPQPIFTFS